MTDVGPLFTQRRDRWRPVLVAAIVVLGVLVVWMVADRFAHPPVAAAPAATVAPAPVDVATVKLLAELMACRNQAMELVGPVNTVRGTWNYHGTAHQQGRDGIITEHEMHLRWAKSLKRRVPEDKVLVAARDVMERTCKAAGS